MVKPLILVDGSSYLYRAFHAMPSLTNSKGVFTGATYGVVNMLRRLLTEYDPEYMAVVFDAKGKTFRDDIYAHYKAHRPPMPRELVDQIAVIKDIIQALGLPLLVVDGVEADDVIGTLAEAAAAQQKAVLISTGDKDLAQLVNRHVNLVNTMTDTLLNPATVKEKFGIPPELIIDYLTLVGDTSDNIPGVTGVGPKTAVKWLNAFGSLDEIVKHADEVKGKVGENLRAALAQLPMCKELVTIKTDVPLPLSLADLKRQPVNREKLIEIYQTLEFKTWLGELLPKATDKVADDKYARYTTIFTEQDFNKWLKKLAAAKVFAVDTETTSLEYMAAELVGLSFALSPGEACYIPVAHTYASAPQQLSRERVLEQLKPILENSNIKKIGHNIKYDLEVLANYDIHLQGVAYDTMLESYILDSTSPNHDMDSLALKYLGWRTITYTDVAGKGAKQVCFDQVAIEQAARYAAEDADVTYQLHETLFPKLTQTPGLLRVYQEIEIPLLSVLARMERTGVLIDVNMLKKQNDQLQKRLTELEEEITTLAGCSFNLNSPKQLQDVLYNQLKLPILQKTPTGQPSTAEGVLQELALDYPLPKLIIEYRILSKLMTTYTQKLPLQINPDTQRIHTSYNQTGAATGRLSSSEPNLQNIPVRREEGRRIRQAFVAPKGYKILSADYSQIELRIMAHISKDEGLLTAFARNLDIHKATAAEVLGIPLEKVTSEERRNAKAINFGLIYGMSAFGLAKQLGINREAAQSYIERYFARYPGVREYMESTRNLAHSRGHVETLLGRRLYLLDINSSQVMRQKAAERTAINAPLQGTAADIIKRAMISLDAILQKGKLDAKMIMQVHDELVFEVAIADIAALTDLVRQEMMAAADLQVPLLVDIGVGDNWDAAAGD